MFPNLHPAELIFSKLTEDTGTVHERLRKARDVLLGPLETEIATTPYEVVYEEDRVKLKHYTPPDGITVGTPLLIVYALINRETMLDLQQGRSVVQNFLKEGIDLYVVDWGYPTRKDRYLDVNDHVNGYMENIVNFIRKRHNISKINLMGVCMGGTFSVMYAALHPEKINTLITTVSPTNFDSEKGLLHLWAKGADVDKIVEANGNMPGDLLNLAFLLLNPARLMIDKYVGLLDNIDDQAFVENFVRMEKWIFDSPDVPGETFKEFIKDFYQENLLIENRKYLGGEHVDLRKITMPLLNIYGRYDHLVPSDACELLTKRVGSTDVEDICIDTGHIGIYVSSKCQKDLVPRIARWLQERERAPEPYQKPQRKPRQRPAKGRGPDSDAQQQAALGLSGRAASGA
jgi:polyhydroxyalkanoate synthase subunit PhaC